MKRDKTLLKTALLWADESNCKRLKVGALLAKDERIISIGFNGTPQGLTKTERFKCDLCNSLGSFENNVCPKCNGSGFIEKTNPDNNCEKGKETNPNVIHAEMNAIMFAAKQGISTDNSSLYVTIGPCVNCAKHILQAGIKRVVYSEDYRDTSGVELLKQFIKVDKINIK